jgi:hypothetical protein
MADSAVAITAGSGTDIDTRTEATNGQHRQVVVLGDPATNAGVAPVDVTAGLKVDLGADNDVTVTGSALTALQLIDDPVQVLGTDTYTEATSKGMTLGAVRRDADTTLVNTTNEFGPLQMDANGRLKVEAFSGETLPVSGTVTETNSATALTALQLIDDIVYTDDTSTHATGTSKGALIMGAATPTDTAVNANDIGAVGMTNNRSLYVSVQDALPAGSAAIGKLAANSGVDIGDVDVTTVGTITPGTAATSLGKAEDAGHTTGDVGVMSLGVRSDAGATGNPTALATTTLDYIPLATDANNRLYTNNAGDIAHDAADSTSNPVKVGGQARTTNPTAVADADRANFITDKLGKQVVVGSVRDLKANQVTTITSSASETTIVTAVASTFLDLYGLFVTNTSATAVNVAIKDSTAGTTRLNIAVPAGETRGFTLNESAAIKQTTVNNNWTATSSASVASLVITALTVANT